MGLRCKRGDLAIIIKSATGANLGKMVEVIEPWNDFDALAPCWDESGFTWKVRSQGSLLSYGGGSRLEMIGPAPDDWLRPIRPDAEPDSVPTTRELAEQ